MSLTHKINLETKRVESTSEEVGFQFRITGYESAPTVIDLTNYRIVACHNTPNSTSELGFNPAWVSPTSLGGTTGVINSITPDYEIYNTTTNPPRRYDTFLDDESGKYSSIVIVHLSANGSSGAITATNGGFESIGYRITRSFGKAFIDKNEISDVPLLGQDALAEGYSHITDSSYVDSSKFILEYYDGGVWKKVSEVIDSIGTPDPNTGLYPYDIIYEAASSPEHSIGVDTTYDHKLITVSADTYIDSENPTTNYGTAPSVSYKINSGNNVKYGLFKYDIENNFSTEIIKHAEMWTYTNNSAIAGLNAVLECLEVSAHWDDTTSTYNNSISAITTSAVDVFNNSPTSNIVINAYNIHDIPTTLIETWKTDSNNYGIATGLSATSTYSNAYNSNLKESGSGETEPRLIVTFTNTGINDKIWHGYQSTSWSDANNWSTSSTIPGPTETAFFDSTVSNNDCYLDINTTINVLSANGYTGVMNLSSSTLTLNSSAYIQDVTNFVASASNVTFENTATANLSANVFNSMSFNGLTTLSGNIELSGTLNGTGTVTVPNSDDSIKLLNGSTSTLTNTTIDGNGTIYVVDNASLDGDGTFTIDTINYISSAADVTLPSGSFNNVSNVYVTNDDSNQHIFELDSGTHNYQSFGVLKGNNDNTGHTIISLSANDPTVNALTISAYDKSFTSSNPIKFYIGDGNVNTGNFYFNSSASNSLVDPVSSSGGKIIFDNIGTYFVQSKGDNIEADLIFRNGTYILQSVDGSGGTFLYANNITVSGDVSNQPTINFNGVSLDAVNDIIVSGDSNTFTNLEGRTFNAGNNIKFIGNDVVGTQRLNLDPTSTWYQNANNKMWAWNSSIQNADASGGTSGFAAATLDEGSNVNWFFDAGSTTLTTIPTINVDTTELVTNTPITLNFTATDNETGVTSADIGTDLDPSIGSIDPSSFDYDVGNNLTFEINITGTTTDTIFNVSAVNGAQLTATDSFGPYTYDTSLGSITFGTSTPSYAISNSSITVNITASHPLGFTNDGPEGVLDGNYNGQTITFTNYNKTSDTMVVATAIIPATTETISGNLQISATNLNDDTFTNSSSAVGKYYTIDLTEPNVSFSHTPSNKLDGTSVTVTATITDNIGFRTDGYDKVITEYYFVDENDVTYNYPASEILSANTTSLGSTASDTFTSLNSADTYEFEISGTGTFYLTFLDRAGNTVTCADSGYIVEPAIVFGTPSPSKNTPLGTNIIVPISAYGTFTDDKDNYYVKILSANGEETEVTHSEVTSAALGINVLSATLSGATPLFGSLIISGGYE